MRAPFFVPSNPPMAHTLCAIRRRHKLAAFKRSHQGIIPPFILNHLSNAFPDDDSYIWTLDETRRLYLKGVRGSVRYRAAAGKAEVQIYDCKNSTRLPGTKARFENDPATADNVINNAFDYHTAVRNFLKQEFGVDSFDGQGGNLIGSCHYGYRYNNAFFNGRQMAYGDGDGRIFSSFVLLDVIGHEFFHGVTDRHSGLEYYGESGALNEHISDAFGVMLRQWVKGLTVDQDSWLVGPGLFTSKVNGKALRDMLNPGEAYDDPSLGKDPQPKNYKERYKGSSDNGGVHINSGIPNKAFALFARSVGGHAWKGAAGRIWFDANCGDKRVGSNANIHQFAAKTVELCRANYSSQVSTLIDAWKEVLVDVK